MQDCSIVSHPERSMAKACKKCGGDLPPARPAQSSVACPRCQTVNDLTLRPATSAQTGARTGGGLTSTALEAANRTTVVRANPSSVDATAPVVSDVFVSHSTKDKQTADAVVVALESSRVRCWVAPRDISPGADWGASIIDAISNSRVMVLVYSANSNESKQVIREVERAVSKGLTIIPLRIDATPPSKNMEYFISTSHWLNAMTPPLEAHLAVLVRTVQGLTAHAPPQPSAVPGKATGALQPSAPTPVRPTAVARQSNPDPRGRDLQGLTLDGKYQILRYVGAGGMGSVWLARDNLGRDVAVKVLLQNLSDDPEHRDYFLNRFLSEARILASTHHENLVSIYYLGEFPADEQGSGFPFIVMDYVVGSDGRTRSIADVIDANRLDFHDAVQLFLETCSALEHVHKLGIWHRDIKPANILIDGNGHARLTDFGIACRNDAQARRVTARTDRLGSPDYMSPEQKNDPTSVNARSDIYSMGVTFAHMLSGELPVGQGWSLHGPIPKKFLKPLDAVIKKAMAAQPDRRYASARELADAVRRAVQKRGAAKKVLAVLALLAIAAGGVFGWQRFHGGSKAAPDDGGRIAVKPDAPGSTQPASPPAIVKTTIATPGSGTPPVATPGSGAPPVVASGSGAPPVVASGSGTPPVVASGSGTPPVVASGSGAPPVVASSSATPPVVASGSGAPPKLTPGSGAQVVTSTRPASGNDTVDLHPTPHNDPPPRVPPLPVQAPPPTYNDLLAALSNDNLKGFDDILARNPKLPRASNPVTGRTMLHEIAAMDKVSFFSHIIEKSDVNATDKEGRMPIHWAAEQGDKDLVGLLMARPGAIVSQPDGKGNTPAKVALARGFEPIAFMLGKDRFKAALDSHNYRGKPDSLDVLLAGNPALVKLPLDENGLTALGLMAWQGDAAAVELLLSNGASPNAATRDGRTALHMAAEHPEPLGANAAAAEMDRARVVRLLLAKGATVLPCNDTTPLHLAADRCRADVMQAFADDPTARLNLNMAAKGTTPLLVAIEKRRWPVARLLIEREETQADQTDAGGFSPLQRAAEAGHAETVLLLIDLKGARAVDLTRQTATGKDTALMLAVKQNDANSNSHLGVIQLLAGRDARLAKLADKDGNTPLLIAVARGSVELVNLLIPQSDLHATNLAGRTALCQAAISGASVAIIKALLDGDKTPDFVDRKRAIAFADAGRFSSQTEAIRATIIEPKAPKPPETPPISTPPEPKKPDPVVIAPPVPNPVPAVISPPAIPDPKKVGPVAVGPDSAVPDPRKLAMAPGEPTFSGVYEASVAGKSIRLTYARRVHQWVYEFTDQNNGVVRCHIASISKMMTLTSPDDLIPNKGTHMGASYTFSGMWAPRENAGKVTEFTLVTMGRMPATITFHHRK
jgi:serine/threonine protein kinase/ankyrin repeat protein